MNATFGKIGFLAALAMSFVASEGHAHGKKHHHGSSCRTEVVSRTSAGPADYHALYASITATNVTIQDFRLKTNDGQVIEITTAPTVINLQNLTAFGQGLQIDTTNIQLPDGSTTIDLVEIETRIVNPRSAVITTSDEDCDLRVPQRLVFYTAAPIALGNEQYIVKVPFSPLASIQIDDVTTITRQVGKRCSQQPTSETERFCSLANKRQAISNIVRRVDEF